MDTETKELLIDILRRLDRIEEKIEILNKGCKKLDNHISFIESIYDRVKRPLFLLTENVSNSYSLSSLLPWRQN